MYNRNGYKFKKLIWILSDQYAKSIYQFGECYRYEVLLYLKKMYHEQGKMKPNT